MIKLEKHDDFSFFFAKDKNFLNETHITVNFTIIYSKLREKDNFTLSGMMMSSYFWGFLGDTQGRRKVILWSLFFSIISSMLSVFVKSFVLFAACRFSSGIL